MLQRPHASTCKVPKTRKEEKVISLFPTAQIRTYSRKTQKVPRKKNHATAKSLANRNQSSSSIHYVHTTNALFKDIFLVEYHRSLDPTYRFFRVPKTSRNLNDLIGSILITQHYCICCFTKDECCEKILGQKDFSINIGLHVSPPRDVVIP